MATAARRAFAIGAHPDDIEFSMAGTLVLLKEAGYEIHYMNVANGSCGTAEHDVDTIVKIRATEARGAAESIGAVFHPSLVNDIEIFYARELLARLGAVMREVAPTILLVPSPNDYMEDHVNTARLAVTAAFCRGMRNFPVVGDTPPVGCDVTVYHAQPHANRDEFSRVVSPGIFVDVSRVMDVKRTMLAKHRSQKEWLDKSQGMDSYLNAMADISREVGSMSGSYEYAEGWRRRSTLGFCPEDADPLFDALVDNARRRAIET